MQPEQNQNNRIDGIHHVIESDGYLDYHKQVHISMFDENRKRVIELFKQSNKNTMNTAIILQGGKDFHRYDTDVDFNFKQESFFAHLFAINEPNCYGAIDLTNNESLLFIPKLPDSSAVWMGKIKSLDFHKIKYGVDYCYYVDDIAKILKQRKINTLYLPKGVNMYSDRENEPVVFDEMNDFNIDYKELMPILCEVRVIKSEKELELMRFVNLISSDAHIQVMKLAPKCVYERELESEFLHFINKHYGCRHVSYSCICCSGHNGAILHYGHAGSPNDRRIQPNDMLLLDMGAEYYNYGSDITCSFPALGKFTDNQKLIYEAVLDSQREVEKHVKAGVSWNYLQRISELVIVKHLINMNIINRCGKTIDDIVDVYRISQLFMPHGFGHLLGLDVHDVDSYSPHFPKGSTAKDKQDRKNSVLRSGMVITVEPGIYFNEALLIPAFDNKMIKGFLNKENILKFMDFGGIRLEDDVIVNEFDCEIITKVPRTIEAIEKLMLQ